jgi:singapore isolate B (sub-type 7) whole genome shotgun sequence assembly, scaffold_16
MNEKQIAACDHFVYIPQYGHGTASLNVNVASSIVMHHFSTWAGYEEAERETERAKYVVESFVTGKDRERTEEEVQLTEERRKKREEGEEDVELMGPLVDE